MMTNEHDRTSIFPVKSISEQKHFKAKFIGLIINKLEESSPSLK